MPNPFVIEPLEERRLLSITWVNRGKADSFDAMYKGKAAVARQIVNAVIADWSAALPKANAKLRISAFDFEAGRRDQNTLGATNGTTVRLDKDGAGKGWYFDPDLSDNADFKVSTFVAPFSASGRFKGSDFYSVAAHEIGHALGFLDAKNGYRDNIGGHPYSDPHHAGDAGDLMYPFLGTSPVRRLISPYDISHTTAGKSIKNPTPPRTFLTATATQGGAFLRINWVQPAAGSMTRIYRSTTPGVNRQAAGATLLATVTSGQRSYVDLSAVPGQTYYYFVVADDKVTYGANATGSLGTTDPVSASASGDPAGIHVAWTLAPDAKSVAVYRSTIDGGGSRTAAGATLVATVTKNWYDNTLPAGWDDKTAIAGTPYYYWAVATFDVGGSGLAPVDVSSPVMSASVALPGSIQGPTDPANPPADAAVHVTPDPLGLAITWTPAAGASGYDVYRAPIDAGSRQASGATLVTQNYNGTAMIDGNVPYGHGFYYWVVARFPDGSPRATYEYPSPVRAYRMTDAEPGTVQATFTGPVITVSLGRSIYDPDPGADHYEIYRSLTYAGTPQASGAQLVGTFAAPNYSFSDFGTPHDVNVYYWVTAVYKPFSDVTITRDFPPFGGIRQYSDWADYQPTGTVTASRGTSRTSIDVDWQPVAGAGGYDVYLLMEDYGTIKRPTLPTVHISDPTASHFTFDTSYFPGDNYNAPGPRPDHLYRIWVVADPGPGLTQAQDLGFDRGYVNAVSATKGIPNGVYLSWTASSYVYGFDIFRTTSPTASPFTGGITYVAHVELGNSFLDTTAQPGVTYYYWIFHNMLSAPVWGTDSGYRV